MEKCCRNCKHHRYRAGESFCKYDAEIKGCMQRVSPDSSCSNFEEGVYTVPQGAQPNNGSLQTLENRSTAKPIPPASQNPYGIRDGLKLAGIAYLLGIIPIVASVSGIMLLIAFIKSFNARDVYNQKKKDIFSILLILIVFLIEIALFVGAFFLNYSYFQSMFSKMDSSTMDNVYESMEWEKLIPTFILSGVAYLVYIIAGILALVKSKKVEPMKQSTSTSYLLPGVSYTKQDGQLLASNHSPQAYQTEQSKFTGGAFMWFLIRFATYAISGLFLGLLYPLMKCTELRWKAEHTYYNGKRLSFDGTAGELFGKYILWILLTVITCGIYSLFMAVNLKRWEIKHTHIAGMNGESEFTGGAFGLFGVRLLTGIVTVITLFLGSFWAHCYKEKWFVRHQVIDGCSINFDGTAMEYFGNRIKWFLLTCITCGIYIFWLQVKSKQWTVKHTYIENAGMIQAHSNNSALLSGPNNSTYAVSNYNTATKKSAYDNYNTKPTKSTKSKAPLIVALCSILAIIILAIVVFFFLGMKKSHNIFTSSIVGKIDLGDNSSKVEEILGEPFQTEIGDSKYEYFSKNYTDLIQKSETLEKKLMDAKSDSEIEKILNEMAKLDSQMEKLEFKYIAIMFDLDKTVTEVLLDTKRTNDDGIKTKVIKNYEVIYSIIPQYLKGGTVTYESFFEDGSYFKGMRQTLVENENADSSRIGNSVVVVWSDSFSDKYKSSATIVENENLVSGNGYYVMDSTLHITKDNVSQFSSPIKNIKEIIVEEGVTMIPSEAYADFTSVEKVTLPTTLTFIGKDAFKNTAYINNTSAYVKGLLYNENYLIAYNPKYTGLVKIKENVKVITEGVFENVRSIELASDMQTIPNNLFEDCVKLERVVIPEGVTSIGKKVFYGCENLLSVTLPNSLISVGEEAFCACYKLLSIVIPDNVKNIDNYAFCACNSLSSIIIGNSVTSIGKYAFGGCNSVKNIKISKSVTSIGDYAFEGCTSLKTVILPVSLTSIGLRVFFECDSLTHIYYEGTKEEFDKMKTDSLPSCIYFYSETRPSTGNNYWHYIKETPTIWR